MHSCTPFPPIFFVLRIAYYGIPLSAVDGANGRHNNKNRVKHIHHSLRIPYSSATGLPKTAAVVAIFACCSISRSVRSERLGRRKKREQVQTGMRDRRGGGVGGHGERNQAEGASEA